MAMAVLERASSPRCPTIITDTTCTKYCDRTTATMGAAKQPSLFTSSHTKTHLEPSSSLFSPPFPFTNRFSSISLLGFTQPTTHNPQSSKRKRKREEKSEARLSFVSWGYLYTRHKMGDLSMGHQMMTYLFDAGLPSVIRGLI